MHWAQSQPTFDPARTVSPLRLHPVASTHKRRQVKLIQGDKQEPISSPSPAREPDEVPPDGKVDPSGEDRYRPFNKDGRRDERDPGVDLRGTFSSLVQTSKAEELRLKLLDEGWGGGEEDEDREKRALQMGQA